MSVRHGPAAGRTMPRIVWTAWFQGEQSMPLLVRHCVESWRRSNPGWDVRVLDAAKARLGMRGADVAGDRLERMPLQKRSNILRMRLLTEEGGVWADATTFCLRPLDDWLPGCMDAGLFCFRDPGPNRLVANWFLASEPGSRLAILWRDAHEEYWRDRDYAHHGSDTPYADLPPLQRLLVRSFARVLNRNSRTADLWFHPFVRSVLRTYPYCVMHFLFAYGSRRNREWGDLFARMPWRDAKSLIGSYQRRPGTTLAEVIEAGRRAGLPLLKLNWRTAWPDLDSLR